MDRVPQFSLYPPSPALQSPCEDLQLCDVIKTLSTMMEKMAKTYNLSRVRLGQVGIKV
jgi:hypothetical protein